MPTDFTVPVLDKFPPVSNTASGWTPWNGRGCPTHPKSRIAVRQSVDSEGYTITEGYAGGFDWSPREALVEYQVLVEHREPRMTIREALTALARWFQENRPRRRGYEDGEWHGWSAGLMPVSGNAIVSAVVLVEGDEPSVIREVQARFLDWGHQNDPVLAFRYLRN